MEYYLSTTVGNKLIKSPFRKDDKPTCGFYYGKKTGRLYLHDFGNEEHYDAIAIIMKKFNIDYTSAINKVLEDYSKIAMLDASRKEGSPKELSWIPTDNVHPYFERFKIPPDYLPYFGVYAAKAVYADEVLWGRATNINPIFVYTQPSGRIRTYRPLSKKKEDKWYGNISAYDVYGLYQLPPTGQTLFVTSSLKDVMVLRVLGFNAIAFSGEGYGTGKEGSESRRVVTRVLEKLSPRFKHIIFFMDNDTAGLQYNEKLSNIYRLPNIAIPTGYPKDISDCIYRYKTNKTRKIMKKLLSRKFNLNRYENTNEYLGYYDFDSSNGSLGGGTEAIPF